MAAQATIAWEVLEDAPEADALIFPVGGGALLAGSLIAARHLKPSLRVIGVEADGVPALTTSLAVGEVITLPEAHTLADGMAVSRPGAFPFHIVRELLDEPLTLVSDDKMADAVRLLMRDAKIVPEFAGAASVAALLSGKVALEPHAVLACVISGGNIDLELLKEIL